MDSNITDLLSQVIRRLDQIQRQDDKLDCLIQKQNVIEGKLSEMTTRLDQEKIFMRDNLAEAQNEIHGRLRDIEFHLHLVVPVTPPNAPVLHQLTYDSGDVINEVKNKLDVLEKKKDLINTQIIETTQTCQNLIRSTRKIESLLEDKSGTVDHEIENLRAEILSIPDVVRGQIRGELVWLNDQINHSLSYVDTTVKQQTTITESMNQQNQTIEDLQSKVDQVCKSTLKFEILTDKLADTLLAQIACFLPQVEENLNIARKDLQAVSDVMVQRFDKISTELEKYNETVTRAAFTVKEDLQTHLTHSDVTQTTDLCKVNVELEQVNMSITSLVENLNTVGKNIVTVVNKIDSMETFVNVEHTGLRDSLLELKQRQSQLTTDVEQALNEMSMIQSTDINLLVIGPTGHGKSATGNSILRRKAFTSACYSQSVTKEIQIEFGKFEGRKIKVVDSPPFLSTNMDNDTSAKFFKTNMKNAITATPLGYHAFLLVFKYGGRYNHEITDEITFFRKVFGDSFIKKHCILVFTFALSFGFDDIVKDNSFQAWCANPYGGFKDIMKECNSRAILFDNTTRDETKQYNQLARLIQMVDNLCIQGSTYSVVNFMKARDRRIKAKTK